MNHVVIAGEYYSENLGDGIIGDTLGHLVSRSTVRPVLHLDISGRTAFQESNSLAKQAIFPSFFSKMPCEELNLLKWYGRRRVNSIRSWASILDKSDTLLIGGGQLLMDNCLDFPLKIKTLVDEADKRGLDIHFVLCGVGQKWSKRARSLFRASLRKARTISVRDIQSADWLRLHDPSLEVVVGADPANWSDEVYGLPSCGAEDSVIGLGIISPDTIRRRLVEHQVDDAAWVAYWVELVDICLERSWTAELFTNGGWSDYNFAERVFAAMPAETRLRCRLAPRPCQPQELATIIQAYKGAVAARLHANIVSFSYRIPTVGLIWEPKVKSFYDETDRKQFALSINQLDAQQTYERLVEAITLQISTSQVQSAKIRSFGSLKSIFPTNERNETDSYYDGK